jgi:xanthine dehydrogenase accessory factor
MLDVLSAAVAALERGETAALLTIVQAAGSTPRRAGAKMLVRADGGCVGTIGGGTMEERAIADAHQALRNGASLLAHYDIAGDAPESLGMCGGSAEVAIDILKPSPRLLIIGAGHIAQSLAAMAALVGMDVFVVDDRPEWASAERFPGARCIHVVAYDRPTETLAPLPVPITPATYVVVATWGWDEPALRQVISTPAPYIGLVGSRRKLALIRTHLAESGIPAAEIERICSPVGLDLGGDTPGEIALAILAEIQMTRTGATGHALSAMPRRVPGAAPATG